MSFTTTDGVDLAFSVCSPGAEALRALCTRSGGAPLRSRFHRAGCAIAPERLGCDAGSRRDAGSGSLGSRAELNMRGAQLLSKHLRRLLPDGHP
eukprot:6602313-Prymnesium_polylepis.2